MKVTFTFIILIFVFLFSCSDRSSNSLFDAYPEYFCDLEELSADSNFFSDNTYKNILYNKAKFLSTEKSFSGKHSIKLNSKNQFGLSVNIPNIKIDDQYRISVWRYSEDNNSKGLLVLSINGKDLYIQEKEAVKKESSGWEQLIINLRIPPFIKTDTMKVYVWQPDSNSVYFDDLRIKKVKDNYIEKYNSESLKIYIDEYDYDKIIQKRQEALDLGILETREDSWVNAEILDNDITHDVKIRLKGDWTDHIKGTKWSFRIKIRKDGSWRGLREFSIQDPRTRFFQYEYFAHKLMQKEGVLSPKYGFIPVYINDAYIGIYAFEEHFVKQLLEANNRREGPILKLSETGFWISNKLEKTENKWFKLPVFESSTILPFKVNKTLKNQKLKKQFLIAQNLLYQHKLCNSDVSELFDIKIAAKYFALTDITKMYHSLRWHNQRFYYNPVTSKLEIIGYDGFTEEGVFNNIKRPIIGNFNPSDLAKTNNDRKINLIFFTNRSFLETYKYYLKKYSDSLYIKDVLTEFRDHINKYDEQLSREYFDYEFNEDFYYENARKIRNDLAAYIEKINSGIYNNINIKNSTKKQYSHEFNHLLPNEFVKVFLEKKQDDSYSYKIINYLSYDIEILSFRNENNGTFSSCSTKKTLIGAYNSGNNELIISSEYLGNTLQFRVEGFEDDYFIPINHWPSPKKESPAQQLLKESKFPLNNYYTIKEDVITFKSGNVLIKQNIIIPENYKVVINAGTKLDFVNNSLFLSYSPIYIKGDQNSEVLISSSDKSAKGFTILQANKRSEINYTEFSGFNTLSYENWILTGAVNFYESDVTINNTTFKDNLCEDALNIIRSNFKVLNCSFENIPSDAFDSDFCTGELSGTDFSDIRNDAVDFSASIVKISNCNITNAGDKGISGGENSKLFIKNCTISGSQTGVASKDKTTIKLSDCKINNCNYGLVAFRKKPEFGPAYIIANNLKYSNLINFHLIEKKSFLKVNNKLISGYDKNTSERFY